MTDEQLKSTDTQLKAIISTYRKMFFVGMCFGVAICLAVIDVYVLIGNGGK
jgi:hypothetical protein